MSATDFVRGSDAAAATLLVYCDLHSPQCDIFNGVLDSLIETYGAELRVVYRLFPIPITDVPQLDKSELSARAVIAAGRQARFWQLRQLLHEKYAAWSGLPPEEFGTWILAEAGDLTMDVEQLAVDMKSAEVIAEAKAAYESATSLGITSIPTVFINGRLQQRPGMSVAGLETSIGMIVLAERQYSSCPPFEINPTTRYLAVLHTEKGDITIELLVDRAPLAVNSFVFLARNGWYDDTTFHRVVPGFIAQAGDPSGTGLGGPGYYFRNEVFVDLGFDKPGVVAMANSGPDTNGSQFFITYAPQPELDGRYTIFGQVIDGMRVVETLAPRDEQQYPGEPAGDKIISIEIRAG